MAECRKNLHTRIILPCLFMLSFNAYGANFDLNTAFQNVRIACSGISDSMNDMKVKAGINTAINAVGTVSGGVAFGTGIAKAQIDKEKTDFLSMLDKAPQHAGRDSNRIELTNTDVQTLLTLNVSSEEIPNSYEQKSKTLGDIRTGTLAASTATNIAGTAIAATNKISDDLEKNINKCIAATKDLSDAKLAAKIEGTAADAEIVMADKIINACREYEYVDTKPINKRAIAAAVSSGIGIGTGLVGTITSGVANTEKVHQGEEQKEKGLNTTSNVMSGATTVASATATIFNATQIAAIKKLVTVADSCEEALR